MLNLFKYSVLMVFLTQNFVQFPLFSFDDKDLFLCFSEPGSSECHSDCFVSVNNGDLVETFNLTALAG